MCTLFLDCLWRLCSWSTREQKERRKQYRLEQAERRKQYLLGQKLKLENGIHRLTE